MADNAQLIAQCEARAKEWLSPAFDEETRKEVQAMLDAADKTALIDALWYHGCRYKPYEQVHCGYGYTGLRQLYPEGIPR